MNEEEVNLYWGYWADYGDRLHLIVTELEECVLVRVYDKKKKGDGKDGNVWEHRNSSSIEEAKQIAIDSARHYLTQYSPATPTTQPRWQPYYDIHAQLGQL